MSNSLNLSVIILTFNEEIHLRRCLENARQISDHVFVVDCFSTDRTVEIAHELGAQVFQHHWENNYAKQFNWALQNLPIRTDWILRLDADEYLFPETIAELRQVLPDLPQEITSLSLPLARIWMGRKMRYGTGRIILKRFFRNGIGHIEERLMDEHVVTTSGNDLCLRGEFADDNLNDLSWWTRKHVDYAVREAGDLLNLEFNLLGNTEEALSQVTGQAGTKRRKKLHYAKLPLFWRSFAYFIYRYFLRGGFLDGREGFLWHFLQGFWYRTLVDAKVLEIKKVCGSDPEKIKALLQEKYHISLH